LSPHSPALTLVLRLAPGVTRTWFGLLGVTGETQLTDRPLLEALTDGASLERLLDVGTPRAGRDVRGVLEVLHSRQLLAWQSLDADGDSWATLTPIRSDVPLPIPARVGDDWRLSRFALMRDVGQDWLVESARSSLTARVSPSAAASIVAGQAPVPLLILLQMGQFLDDEGDSGPARYWEFHDRYFASRSRMDAQAAGGTFRFAGEHDPDPFGTCPPHQHNVIALPTPDVDDPGPGLWSVTERRASHRDVSAEPIEIADLGSLLWHTLRVREVRHRDESSSTSYDVVLRPVPSAGGTHSIGLWLACRNVIGIDPGLWWYDPVQHALLRVGDLPSWGQGDTYAVQGILISQHARLAWKYERIAHALALKDCGVVLHALQMGATALGLAMCPIGSRPTAPLLDALGLDADEYVPVGEFWLAMPS
jgi:SagB-type dehydrogenase family enzyme